MGHDADSPASTVRSTTDVDGDAWADLPDYARGVVRPRIFWDEPMPAASFFATAGTTWEDRNGGTMPARVLTRDRGAPYVEALETRRFDGGVVGQTLLGGRFVVTARRLVHARSDRISVSATSASATCTRHGFR